ncbi:hypothetical protein BC831DRAFT_465205 [Entophlyctis helioformis]|nr:hypothetical protein BC831DRAFT_465205 [Entophlyctis helioformis]
MAGMQPEFALDFGLNIALEASSGIMTLTLGCVVAIVRFPFALRGNTVKLLLAFLLNVISSIISVSARFADVSGSSITCQTKTVLLIIACSFEQLGLWALFYVFSTKVLMVSGPSRSYRFLVHASLLLYVAIDLLARIMVTVHCNGALWPRVAMQSNRLLCISRSILFIAHEAILSAGYLDTLRALMDDARSGRLMRAFHRGHFNQQSRYQRQSYHQQQQLSRSQVSRSHVAHNRDEDQDSFDQSQQYQYEQQQQQHQALSHIFWGSAIVTITKLLVVVCLDTAAIAMNAVALARVGHAQSLGGMAIARLLVNTRSMLLFMLLGMDMVLSKVGRQNVGQVGSVHGSHGKGHVGGPGGGGAGGGRDGRVTNDDFKAGMMKGATHDFYEPSLAPTLTTISSMSMAASPGRDGMPHLPPLPPHLSDMDDDSMSQGGVGSYGAVRVSAVGSIGGGSIGHGAGVLYVGGAVGAVGAAGTTGSFGLTGGGNGGGGGGPSQSIAMGGSQAGIGRPSHSYLPASRASSLHPSLARSDYGHERHRSSTTSSYRGE